MEAEKLEYYHERLVESKNKITEFIKESPPEEIRKLLHEIDDALLRIQDGTYGICQVCNDPIEPERLAADPLSMFCLDHLTAKQQKNLEQDINLAAKIQHNLLPSKELTFDGWDIAFHYEPAGVVSGDYCDIIRTGDSVYPFYVILGDVAGKGISAAMLMNQLHATFHALIPLNLSPEELMERMNRVLCESTLDDHFATLLLAIVNSDGVIKICNAGHCHPILHNGESREIESTGIPLGVMHDAHYESQYIALNSGDTLFLYTDGLIEAMKEEEVFGTKKLLMPKFERRICSSSQIIENTLEEFHEFLGVYEKSDDLTILVLKKL